MHKIRLLRLIKGMTQIDLAQRSGVPVGRIHLIETGRAKMRSIDSGKLANALDVKISELQGEAYIQDFTK